MAARYTQFCIRASLLNNFRRLVQLPHVKPTRNQIPIRAISTPARRPRQQQPPLQRKNGSPHGPGNKRYMRDDALFRSDKAGKIAVSRPPTFSSKEEERQYQKQHLAVAFRALARQGFDEGLAGHISLRDPVNPDHFWINPVSKHFAQIRASDLVLSNEHGEVQPGGAQEPFNFAAFSIHSAIHKARPDLNSACHAHSIHGKAFSCFGKPLEMLCQDSVHFHNDLAVYAQYGAPLSPDEGVRIAQALGGSCRSLILQNHGLITCGKTPDEAAFLFMALDRCCHAQLMANAASGVGWEKTVISEEEAESFHRDIGNSDYFWLSFQPYYDQEVAADPSVLE